MTISNVNISLRWQDVLKWSMAIGYGLTFGRELACALIRFIYAVTSAL